MAVRKAKAKKDSGQPLSIHFDLNSPESYRLFLKVKALPRYRIVGRTAEVPAEYAGLLGLDNRKAIFSDYEPLDGLFDYQEAIARLAIRKRKFAAFVRMGYGKTLIMLEFARYVSSVLPKNQRILINSPLMVVKQTLSEAKRFYGESLPIVQIRASQLPGWTQGQGDGRIGITNYEAITDAVGQGVLGCIINDESAMLKSMYGKWGLRIIQLGKGLQWKLCLTGMPALNDRIEYANHAVFLDQFPTTNAFLARYFINRGQTSNRWELKAHALKPFYRSLSDWSIFMTNPATYGWKDNVGTIPPIEVHIQDVDLTPEQAALVHKAGGDIFGTPGGITSRAKLAQLAKGWFQDESVPSNKPAFIKGLVDSWPDESTIIWCKYNREQDSVAALFPGAANIEGKTKEDRREELIDDFKAGRRKQLITKPECLGFGLNLQVATRHIFSTCQDSLEDFAQAIARSNRVGSTKKLHVHLPVTELEKVMADNTLRKAKDVEADNAEQERIFKEVSQCF